MDLYKGKKSIEIVTIWVNIMTLEQNKNVLRAYNIYKMYNGSKMYDSYTQRPREVTGKYTIPILYVKWYNTT